MFKFQWRKRKIGRGIFWTLDYPSGRRSIAAVVYDPDGRGQGHGAWRASYDFAGCSYWWLVGTPLRGRNLISKQLLLHESRFENFGIASETTG